MCIHVLFGNGTILQSAKSYRPHLGVVVVLKERTVCHCKDHRSASHVTPRTHWEIKLHQITQCCWQILALSAGSNSYRYTIWKVHLNQVEKKHHMYFEHSWINPLEREEKKRCGPLIPVLSTLCVLCTSHISTWHLHYILHQAPDTNQ